MAEAANSPEPSSTDTTLSSDLGSQLCTRCGLCCTGALHGAAVLDPEEIAGARALGLHVSDLEKPVFALPCPRLDGTVCTIYGMRPRVCGRYKCQLLHDLQAGLVAFDEAADKVDTARALSEEAERAMPAGMTLPEARRLASSPPKAVAGGGAEQVDNMQIVLRITAFNLYLDRHFRNPRDGKFLEFRDVSDPADVRKTT